MKQLKDLLNVQNLLWLALALALIGSLRHLAYIFAGVDGSQFAGWLQAIAIDAGLFALAYSMRSRKAEGRGVKVIWFGIAMFTGISIYGNLAYGFIKTTGALPAWITLTKPYVLAATLPVLVLYLAELISDNRQYSEQQASKAAEQDERPKPPKRQPVFKPKTKQAAIERLVAYYRDNPEASLNDAGQVINRSKTTVSNYLTELEEAGKIHRNGDGVEILNSTNGNGVMK